jgi:hypothetical protein
MKSINFKELTLTVLILIFPGICAVGYSQKKSETAPVKGGIRIVYGYPEGKIFKYFSDSKIVQDMDVNGQSMLVNVSMHMGCEVRAAGKIGENLKLEIKIDSMAQNVEAPQGTAGGPINEVKGKVFNMVISPSGKTVDLTEASKIVYTMEGSGENNMTQTFLNYFPALPSNELTPGDVWISNDTVNSKSPTNSLYMPVESNYKFEGIEKIDGIDCAKVTASLSGTRKMTTQSQGMEIHTSGTYTGTMVLFIALKEGYLMKEAVTTKMTGTIEIPDQNMSFPVVMTIISTNGVVK